MKQFNRGETEQKQKQAMSDRLEGGDNGHITAAVVQSWLSLPPIQFAIMENSKPTGYMKAMCEPIHFALVGSWRSVSSPKKSNKCVESSIRW